MSIFQKRFQIERRHIVAFLLALSAMIGVVRFVLFIIPRSKPDNQLIFGLSAARVALGSVFLGLLLVNIVIVLFALMDLGPKQKAFKEKLIALGTKHHALIMAILYLGLILIGAFFLATTPPVIRPFRSLLSIHDRLSGFLSWVLIADLLAIVSLWLVSDESMREQRRKFKLDTFFVSAILLLSTVFLYYRVAVLIGWINKTNYSFWDLLAGQLLQGKLYLENPPYTHDLTLYNGRWYVPMPPLPGILLVPFAYLLGVEDLSTSYFSIVSSAINGVLLFLILRELVARKWIELSGFAMFWLIVIFLFGTPHLWVGISGRGWYVSQILTVLFLALAVYAALRSWSAWWIAAFLGIAMLARPNSLMTWPFVFAISMQILKEKQGSVTWNQAFTWAAKTVIPIALAIVVQLGYNYLRFEKITDFGYTTVNAGPEIVESVQKYGLFSPHFIPNNLYVMLLRPPRINWGTPWPTEPKGALWPIDPTTTGMSIFMTTPVLLYLFRRYPKQWWVLGAWAGVLCNVIFLSFYSNTGAHQFGYRYVLDFLVPLMMLLAVGLGKKVPWHFVLLIFVSIAINLYGAYWFMNG